MIWRNSSGATTRRTGTSGERPGSEETPDGRWRRYGREELLARDKASLDLFCLKDKSLTDLDNMPEPEDPAEEIIENLEVGWRACGLCWRHCGHRRKAVPWGVSAFFPGLSASSPRGYAVAGFATRNLFAGHLEHSTSTRHALKLKTDHLSGEPTPRKVV